MSIEARSSLGVWLNSLDCRRSIKLKRNYVSGHFFHVLFVLEYRPISLISFDVGPRTVRSPELIAPTWLGTAAYRAWTKIEIVDLMHNQDVWSRMLGVTWLHGWNTKLLLMKGRRTCPCEKIWHLVSCLYACRCHHHPHTINYPLWPVAWCIMMYRDVSMPMSIMSVPPRPHEASPWTALSQALWNCRTCRTCDYKGVFVCLWSCLRLHTRWIEVV